MYFHIIGIKEKEETQYELDFLISWWDEDFIRDFLSHRWVVVVSFDIFKEDYNEFGNISMSTIFRDKEIQVIIPWDDLSERLYFFTFLWLNTTFANYIKNPIPESEMNQLIETTINKIKLVNEEIQQKQNEEELKEQKKYEEKAVKDSLKVINHNIDIIEQVVKAWTWIISWTDITKLEDCLNEMKKIRLWTNFNKMANTVLEAHHLVKQAEKEILQAYDSQKFIIEKNSSVTNIDVIYEDLVYNKISDKATLMPKILTTTESVVAVLWSSSIFLKLLQRDLLFTFEQTTFSDFFRVLINLCEYFVLTGIIFITILWLIAPIIGLQDFSLYLLPACGWLWLLIYLFNSLNLKKTLPLILTFIILAIVYWRGVTLLLNTFAM